MLLSSPKTAHAIKIAELLSSLLVKRILQSFEKKGIAPPPALKKDKILVGPFASHLAKSQLCVSTIAFQGWRFPADEAPSAQGKRPVEEGEHIC